MLDKLIKLTNGVQIPTFIMGTSLCDLKGEKKRLENMLVNSIDAGLANGIRGFDTARDYDNENLLGATFKKFGKKYGIKREDIFITTKVGNGQQRLKNMSEQIDISLKNIKTDYIDLWMLHWPYPDYYIDNWKQLEDIYISGKVRSIGICNCRERHLEALLNCGISIKPMVAQFEYHPFRTVPSLMEFCKMNNIQIEAYSSLCCMLPFVRENNVLRTLSAKYGKSIAQIILRWHIQQGVIPIFRSFKPERIKLNIDIFNFELEDEDMSLIYSLDKDYKFHPESMNCPGF
jgi:diketogulonate reductase-like aldo/keto reductase